MRKGHNQYNIDVQMKKGNLLYDSVNKMLLKSIGVTTFDIKKT